MSHKTCDMILSLEKVMMQSSLRIVKVCPKQLNKKHLSNDFC